MSDYQIEKDVPLPANGVVRRKYPFADLKVGQSFHVPIKDASPSTVQQAAFVFAAINKGYKFTTRKDAHGVRVWRIIPPLP